MRTGVFRFGGFVLDVPAYELRRQGRSVRLERRPMELLLLLVDRRGELITRDEIVARLWGRDVFIDIDTSVNTAIRKIRRALRDSADESRFVQTVQGKGYRFIADVEAATSEVLAVLPFENLQGDPNHDYLADGLTEETIVGLGQFDPERFERDWAKVEPGLSRHEQEPLRDRPRARGRLPPGRLDPCVEQPVSRDGNACTGPRPGADLDRCVRARVE